MFGNVTFVHKKMLGNSATGELLHAGQELDNAVDKLAVKVVQNNKTVSH